MDGKVQGSKKPFVLVLNGPVKSDGFSTQLHCLSPDRQQRERKEEAAARCAPGGVPCAIRTP